MGKLHTEISAELRAWIEDQHLFFVSTAPLAADGHINCSPKGLDTFRVIGPRDVAYLDLTGSGAETIAHVRENGRIVFMFCAFDGAPKIVRLHGSAAVHFPGSAEWEVLAPHFGHHPGARCIVRATVGRISDSCGWGVPRYAFDTDRDSLPRWAEQKGPDGVARYQREKNARSIDGLPGVD